MSLFQRLQARLRTSSSFRVVSTELSLAEANAADRLSFFVVVKQVHSSGRPLVDVRPFLQTAGFAANWSAALAHQPRRFSGIDRSTLDRFVTFAESSATRSLATVRIGETYAWDLHYRSEVAATGILIRVELHPQALVAIAAFLDTNPGLDHGDDLSRGCVLRFPVRRAFRFPEPRGAENPYTGSLNGTDRLKEIATVRSDSFEMAVATYPSSAPISWEAQPLAPLVASSTILRLSLV